MSVSLQYDFKEVERYFNNISDPSTILDLKEYFGEELVTISMQSFEKETDPVSNTKWEKSLRAKITGGQTLSKRGLLKSSITYLVEGDKIRAGSPLIYSAIHNNGGEIHAKRGYLKFKIGNKFIQKKSVTIPQRRFLGVPNDFIERSFDNKNIKDLIGV